MDIQNQKKLHSVSPDPTRKERMKADLTARIDALAGSTTGRVNWHDLSDVQRRTEAYLQACAQSGTVPTIMGLSAYGYGVTRQALYDYLRAHSSEASAQYIDVVRDALADYLCGAALKSDVNPVSAIFCLKNLHGFADRVEVTPASTQTAQIDIDDIRQRYVTE